ncbi:hypothetical protein E3P81_01031 [Wallemia ichthyophaga]|nr:hypothetical protein E3P97_01032 [Wallemia ichthyophaga]TIB30849.1 hypothetical protein E3P85_02521 [Wallemia ichthyophaga]TIB49034.1 hypothetical protein E3P82_01030 [Wallemia ichthyophaga]TIB53030.1 hypothetical protein E3P81_01031 [Wallemia ichthyophaga]TIB55657.1 hypothetical protein E3P80_01031 [Wallemia ichthyophaga]
MQIVQTSLILIRNLSSTANVRLLSRRPVLIALLDLFIKLERTHEDDDSVFHLAFVIVSSIIENEDVDTVWNILDTFEDEPLTPPQAAFIKCLDAYIHQSGPGNLKALFLIPFLMRTLDFCRTSMLSSTSAQGEPDPRLGSVVQTSLVAAETFTVFQSAFEETRNHPLLASARSSQLPELAVGALEASLEFLPSIKPFSKESEHDDPLKQFANFKPALMRLISVVAGSDADVKERIGSVGGLRACMNCAHVDMRESCEFEIDFEALFNLTKLKEKVLSSPSLYFSRTIQAISNVSAILLNPKAMLSSKVDYELKDKDSSSYKKYLKRAGEDIANALGFEDPHLYQLQSLPEGYRLYAFDSKENGINQKVTFLFGSIHVKKFTSIKAFTPHAVWLKTDRKQRHENCKCNKRYHVKHTLRSEAIRVTMKDPGPPPPTNKTVVRQQDYTIQPQTVAPQKLDRDRSTPSLLRLYELCWVRLDRQGLPFLPPPDIATEQHKLFVDNNYKIDYWPGEVVDFQFNVEVRDGQPIHKRQFEVFLLGTKTLVMVDEDRIRPYLSLIVQQKHFPPTYFPLPRFQNKPDVLFENISDIPHIANQDVYDRALALTVGIRASWNLKHHVTPIDHYQLIVKYQPEPLDCFKGIWLGGEMIWLGDMVRLHRSVGIEGGQPENASSICMLVYYLIALDSTVHAVGALYAVEPTNEPAKPLKHYPDIMLDQEAQRHIPLPPSGHKWSRLAQGKHHTIPIDVIGGRYYPKVQCESGTIKNQLMGLEPADDATMMSFNYHEDESSFKPYVLSVDRNISVTEAKKLSQLYYLEQWKSFISQLQELGRSRMA